MESNMKKISFNENWRYGVLGCADKKSVVLPHDAMFYEPREADSLGGTNTGYFRANDYEYEKAFTFPKDYEQNALLLEFEGVYRDAEVYLNGEKLAYRPYGYTNFYVELTDKVKFGEENLLRVIARNADQPNTRWYSGAGIYRPVYLYVGEKEHIALEGGVKIDTLSINPAAIRVTVLTTCAGEIKIELSGDKLITSLTKPTSGVAVFETEVEGAKLWSPSSPYLYTLKATFNGKDEESVSFGIRTIECDAKNGFRINGERFIMHGACIHHDNGLLGATCHPYAEYRKVKLLKEAGYDAIRSAHNPCSKALLDACDRLGMLVMDELVDMWYIHKTKYDYADHFDEWWKKDALKMINKDYNHPSVVIYSVGNEVSETAKDRGINTMREMHKYCHNLDSNRFVTCGINIFFNYLSAMGFGVYSDKKAEKTPEKPKKVKKQAVGSEFFNNLAGMLGADFMKFGATLSGSDKYTKKAFKEMDIAGYNYGIKRYKKDLKKYPDRVICGSETFCSDAYKFMEIARDNPALIGDFVWVGMDYLGEVGLGSWEYKNYAPDYSHGVGWITAGSGRLDITGRSYGELAYTRVAFGLDKIRIGVIPVDNATKIHSPSAWRHTNSIESWSFNGLNGYKTKVEVYAQAYRVALFINGKKVGEKTNTKDCLFSFNVKYYDGEVTAIAYDKSRKVIAKTSLKTAENSTKLMLSAEEKQINKDQLCYVNVRYTDENGIDKPLVRGDVKFSVSGGKLLGVGNGCSYYERSYLSDTADTYYGMAAAVIEPTDDKITVLAESPFGNAETTVLVK